MHLSHLLVDNLTAVYWSVLSRASGIQDKSLSHVVGNSVQPSCSPGPNGKSSEGSTDFGHVPGLAHLNMHEILAIEKVVLKLEPN